MCGPRTIETPGCRRLFFFIEILHIFIKYTMWHWRVWHLSSAKIFIRLNIHWILFTTFLFCDLIKQTFQCNSYVNTKKNKATLHANRIHVPHMNFCLVSIYFVTVTIITIAANTAMPSFHLHLACHDSSPFHNMPSFSSYAMRRTK